MDVYKNDMAAHVIVEHVLFLTSKLKKQMPFTELHIISTLPSGGSNVKRMTVLYMLHLRLNVITNTFAYTSYTLSCETRSSGNTLKIS